MDAEFENAFDSFNASDSLESCESTSDEIPKRCEKLFLFFILLSEKNSQAEI